MLHTISDLSVIQLDPLLLEKLDVLETLAKLLSRIFLIVKSYQNKEGNGKFLLEKSSERRLTKQNFVNQVVSNFARTFSILTLLKL